MARTFGSATERGSSGLRVNPAMPHMAQAAFFFRPM